MRSIASSHIVAANVHVQPFVAEEQSRRLAGQLLAVADPVGPPAQGRAPAFELAQSVAVGVVERRRVPRFQPDCLIHAVSCLRSNQPRHRLNHHSRGENAGQRQFPKLPWFFSFLFHNILLLIYFDTPRFWAHAPPKTESIRNNYKKTDSPGILNNLAVCQFSYDIHFT